MDAVVKGKPRAYLDLVRLPNLFTAAANVIAAHVYSGGGPERWSELVCLVSAAVCLYAGGVTLNDVCDVDHDRAQRPQRPIPSGQVSRSAASGLAVGLLAVGLIAAAFVSARAAMIAGFLVVAIVLYDVVLKSTPAAPALMGLCRALNLALGMHAADSIWTATALTPIGLMWLYTTSVTYFARHEAAVSSAPRLIAGTVGVCTAVAGLSALVWLVPNAQASFLWPLGMLAVGLGFSGFRAASRPSPQKVQAAVKTFVISLILFDACLAWAATGPMAALLIALLIIPTILLTHWARVT